jgi:spore coat polysaccharide biosynthesis protein SpsF
MGSTRLPGKILKPLAGKPLIDHVIDRLKRIDGVASIVVATSILPDNDLLEAHLRHKGVLCFRGSEDDVLDRYCQAARRYDFDHVVRATGDNPFVDHEEGRALVMHHVQGGFDYCCNFPDQGGLLPIGLGLEIFTRQALETCWRDGLEQHHREHVDEYIYDKPELFRTSVPPTPANKQAPALRLTVDTPEDFAKAEALIVAWRAKHGTDQPDTAWLIEAAR